MYKHAATKPNHCYTIMYHKESVLSSCFPMCQFNTNAANCGGSHCRHGGTNNFQASWTVRTKCLKFEEEKMLCSMLPCLYRPGAWLFALTPDFEEGHCWTYQQQGSMCVTRITSPLTGVLKLGPSHHPANPISQNVRAPPGILDSDT